MITFECATDETWLPDILDMLEYVPLNVPMDDAEEWLRETIARETTFVMVSLKDQVPIGCLIAYPDPFRECVIHLFAVYVDAEQAEPDTTTRAHALFEAWARNVGATTITAYVRDVNAVNHFSRKYGYEIESYNLRKEISNGR